MTTSRSKASERMGDAFTGAQHAGGSSFGASRASGAIEHGCGGTTNPRNNLAVILEAIESAARQTSASAPKPQT